MADELDDLGVELGEQTSSSGVSAPKVFVRHDVLEAMEAHAQQDLDNELGGILVGSAGSSPEGTLVFVEAAIPALHTDAARGSVTFTHDTWANINRIKDDEHPDKRIVGWYHTHPGFGLFLSEYDLFIHRSFFDAPWQIALVIDPRAETSGFFVWRDGELQGPGPCYIVGETVSVETPADQGAAIQAPARAPEPPPRKTSGAWQWPWVAVVALLVALCASQALRPPPVIPAGDAEELAAIRLQLEELKTGVRELKAPKTPLVARESTYTVREGDSLWSIAKEKYGDGTKWSMIAASNNISGDDLTPGMVLTIPEPPSTRDEGSGER